MVVVVLIVVIALVLAVVVILTVVAEIVVVVIVVVVVLVVVTVFFVSAARSRVAIGRETRCCQTVIHQLQNSKVFVEHCQLTRHVLSLLLVVYRQHLQSDDG